MKSIAELIKEYGFKFKGSCYCNNYETIKYKKDSVQLHWRKGAATFKLFTPFKMFSNSWEPLVNLESKLLANVSKGEKDLVSESRR